MALRLATCILCVISFAVNADVHAGKHSPGSGRAHRDASGGFLAPTDQKQLQDAILAALGAGRNSKIDPRLAAVKAKLAPTWSSLAKDAMGRTDEISLRYAAHRYLMQTYRISVQGLEPVLQGLAGSSEESKEFPLLAKIAPAIVKQHFEMSEMSRYSFDDLAAFIIMLEELVRIPDNNTLVDDIFRTQPLSREGTVPFRFFARAMESYLQQWILAGDPETIEAVQQNTSFRDEIFEDWVSLSSMVHGLVHSHAYEQSRQPLPKGSSNPLSVGYSFEDFHEVTGRLVTSFGEFWHDECEKTKDKLLKLEHGATGRVRIADFHNTALSGEWRFSESKEYLRKIGALDETSITMGPSVIIPNYLRSANNCVVSQSHYKICCWSPCEDYLSDIEEATRTPLAMPEQILAVVANMTLGLDDFTVNLPNAMESQLYSIAALHGGRVPVHGRLFAQWLHYVFPRDCPYPHKAGTVSDLLPMEFGDNFVASDEEMEHHASQAFWTLPNSSNATTRGELFLADDDWMMQWSHEEELLSLKMHALHAPSSLRIPKLGWLFATLVSAGLAIAMLLRLQGARIVRVFTVDGNDAYSLSYLGKTHHV